MKKIIGKIHLWLGFASGLIVFVIAVTGCMLAFEIELRNMFCGYMSAPVQAGKTPLAPTVLMEIAGKHMPGKQPNGVNYQGPGKSVAVQYYGAGYFNQVFMDPYSGKVLKVWEQQKDFFRLVLDGHYYLWLPPKIGHPLVATATLIFVVMLISGLVLWWPRNKAAAKQRFSIKWNARWRRKNYDLHNVLGFYVLLVAMMLALTGLVWGFEWYSNGTYYLTTGKSLKDVKPALSDTTGFTTEAAKTKAIDAAWRSVYDQAPASAGIAVYLPFSKTAALSVFVNYRPGTYYKGDNFSFDQYTLKPLQTEGPYGGKYASLSAGDKLRRMNYDLHTGAVWGLWGKMLMFCASFICATLPVTGVYIWWGRRKKTKKGKVVKPVVVL